MKTLQKYDIVPPAGKISFLCDIGTTSKGETPLKERPSAKLALARINLHLPI